jgi:hypothetical protein
MAAMAAMAAIKVIFLKIEQAVEVEAQAVILEMAGVVVILVQALTPVPVV